MATETKPRETPRSAQAFADYVAMGSRRSLLALVAGYRRQTATDPPSRRLETLQDWSVKYAWQKRIAGAITDRTAAMLDEAAELDTETFAITSRLLRDRVSQLTPLFLDAILDVRKGVRPPAPKSDGVTVNVVLTQLAERIAAERGLDPAAVVAEAVRIIAESP